MSQFSGYSKQGTLHETDTVRVFRALRESDGQQVVVKAYRGVATNPEVLRHRRTEFNISKKLAGLSGIIRMYDLEQTPEGTLLVMEDIEGVTLHDFLRAADRSLAVRLELARGIVRAVGQMHGAGIIHNDLSPRNVLVHGPAQAVKLIDFGSASTVGLEARELSLPETMRGTPHYMSPEQTGRMNRSVDYRSDFYALGAVLYELFTGRTVFESNDVLELLHSHLARAPQPLQQVASGIPPALSEVVLKLLAKHAEDRYQSAEGLEADFAEVARQLEATGKVEVFPLGRFDMAAEIDLPERLYGREREVDRLLEAFDDAANSKRVLLLVGGPSGMGKTALVNEVHRPLTQKRGLFLSGKFEALKRDIPYHALTEAFGGVLQQLLALPEQNLVPVREALQQALAPSAQVLCDVFPELTTLLGPQPKLEALAPHEAQIRFELQFNQLVIGLLGLGRHLVLFLDDMQWADRASMRVLEVVLRSREVKHLMVVGSYRTAEVGADHPLHDLEKTAREAEAVIYRVDVKPLEAKHVLQMVSDALRCPPEAAAGLASLVFQRSGGNPLFVREFLRALRQGGALERDAATRQWRIDTAKVEALRIPDNVVDLLLEKLRRLPPRLQQVVASAACLGREVEPELLALAMNVPEDEAHAQVAECAGTGLLVRVREAGDRRTSHFRFVHDKIQEAASLLLDSAERARLHARVGQLLLERIPAEERDKRLFEVVNHLNLGAEGGLDASVAKRLPAMNLAAGRHAMASAAHEVAARYFDRGLELLPKSAWEQDYPTALGLHEDGAETAWLRGRLEVMEERAREVDARARTALEKVRISEVRILAMVSQNRPREAIDVGYDMLAQFGIRMPRRRITKVDALASLFRAHRALKARSTESVKSMPTMTDPRTLAVMRIFGAINLPAYFTNPFELVVQVKEQLLLSLNHGMAPETCNVIMGYAMMVIPIVDVKRMEVIREMGLHLGRRPESRLQVGRARVVATYFLLHRYQSYRDTGPELLQAYRECIEGGDFKYAAVALNARATWAFHATPNLDESYRLISEGVETMRAIGRDEHLLTTQLLHQQLGYNLIHSEMAEPWRYTGPHAFEDQIHAKNEEAKNQMGRANLAWFTTTTRLLFNRTKEASAIALAVGDAVDVLKSAPTHPRALTIVALGALSDWANLTPAEQARARKLSGKTLKRLVKYAADAPMNFQHMVAMLRADLARVAGDLDACCRGYEEAARLAREQAHDPILEPLAYELAARACEAAGRNLEARGFLQEALGAWARWGAWTKVEQLRRTYPSLKGAAMPTAQASNKEDSTGATTTSTGTGDGLDLKTVLKASHALSREIEVRTLQDRMLEIMLESAGADGGAILLWEDGKLHPRAASRVPDKAAARPPPTTSHAESIVQFTARTRQPLVVDDALADERFKEDPHVRAANLRSALGLPIVQGGELVAVLYLENQKLARAFSPHRVQLLSMLATQAAISLTNAQLYDKLKRALARAEESSRLKSEFLANVSHELRTPLNSIINLPEGLLGCFTPLDGAECAACGRIFELDPGEKVDPSVACPACSEEGTLAAKSTFKIDWDPSMAARHLRDVASHGRALLRMVDDVLESSKLESVAVELSMKDVPILELLDRVESSFSSDAEVSAVKLVVEKCDPALTARLDPARVWQILSNLISNALKFSDGRGRVDVSARAEGDWVHFQVKDEGVGIAQEHQRLIFESFRQAESGHTRRFGGTGLGLSIAQRLAGLHSGRVTVESVVGRGSVFTLSLPRSGPAPKT